MKNLIIRYIRRPGILWLMICSFLFPATAQTLEETISFADEQFYFGNYQLAVKEYQRALFFSKGQNVDYLYHQIAHSFFINKQYGQASYFYELSYKTSQNDSARYEILFNKAQCYLLSGNYNQALVELMNLPDSTETYFKEKQSFYFAVCYFGLEDFQKSENYFLSLLDTNDLQSREKISTLFSKKRNLYRPNPKTAKTLSRILPGMGQVYSGDLKNGLNSLALTGGFVALGFVMANEYTVLDAILTSLPWFLRYYQGGYAKAYNIAHDKRAMRRNKTYKEVLEIISNTK